MCRGGGGRSCREDRWETQACGRGWKGVGAGGVAVLVVGEMGACDWEEGMETLTVAVDPPSRARG